MVEYLRCLRGKADLVTLQSPYYYSNNMDKSWSNERGRKSFFCPGSKHSKRVKILFNPKLNVEIV